MYFSTRRNGKAEIITEKLCNFCTRNRHSITVLYPHLHIVASFRSRVAGIRLKFHNDMLPEPFSPAHDPPPSPVNPHKGTRNPTQEYDFLPRGHES